MYEKRNDEATSDNLVHPLKLLTRAQFAALGGDAVAYVRSMHGDALAAMVKDGEFENDVDYQLVMSADGKPLLVADSQDAALDWVGEQNLGLATLH